MTVRPITLVAPQTRQLLAGKLTELRRPLTHLLGNSRPGDRLWVREPFHLDIKFRHLSPTAAAGMGAKPFFETEVADLPVWARADLGNKVFARNLLRIWHRQHLVVTEVRREHLQAIRPDAIAAEGFANRAAYAAAWDRNLSMAAASDAWRFNPEVAVIRFERIGAPLP